MAKSLHSVILDGLSIINGSSLYGGGIHCTTSDLTVLNCRISNNQAFTEVDCDAKKGDWNFAPINTCSGGCPIIGGLGGGIYASASTLTLASSFISSNTGTVGGGVFGTECSYLTILDSTVESNLALTKCIVTSGTCCIYHTSYVECFRSPYQLCAGGYGGGIQIDRSSMILKSSLVRSNRAGIGGGGVHATRGTDRKLLFEDSTIQSNSLGEDLPNLTKGGGGISCAGFQATFLRVRIKENRSSGNGGGVALHEYGVETGSAIITECSFEGNIATNSNNFPCGGGLFISDRVPVVVSRSSLFRNEAYSGGGSYSQGPQTFTSCRWIDNKGNLGGAVRGSGNYMGCEFSNNDSNVGGALFGRNFTFTNCLVAFNSAVRGGALSIDEYNSPCRFINCTVYGNRSSRTGAIFVEHVQHGRVSIQIINSVLWNPGSEVEGDGWWISFSDVQGGAPGIGNIDEYPSFVDSAQGDFRLLNGSPCIDSGSSDAIQEGTHLFGNARIQGESVDIGAIEAPSDFAPGIGSSPFNRYFVSLIGDTNGPGDTWETAFDSIENALERTRNGTEVWVKGGVYKGRVLLENGVSLFGGFAGNEASLPERHFLSPTVLESGTDATRIIHGSGLDSATLDGFTIRGGMADAGGGMRLVGPGSYTVVNCQILQNQALSNGGGIYCTRAPHLRLVRCSVGENNATEKGGGIHLDKETELAILDCRIFSNSALEGGGLYVESCSGAISQSTIEDNGGGTSAGGAFFSGTLLISSCTFQNNTAAKAAGVNLSGANNLILEDCRILSNTASSSGGGISIARGSNPNIKDSLIVENNARLGAGVFVSKDALPVIEGCKILRNYAFALGDLSPPSGSGAGVFAQETRTSLSRCLVKDNTAEYEGGGLCGSQAAYTVKDSTFSGNQAYHGGGISLRRSLQGASPESVFTNCLMAKNQALSLSNSNVGGAASLQDGASSNFTNCTLVDNKADYVGGIAGGILAVTNCILWNQGIEIDSTNVTVRYSSCQGGCFGEGNQGAYPLFQDQRNGHYRLADHSPCIEAATPLEDFGPTSVDLDGNPRIQNSSLDIGCYEASSGYVQGPTDTVNSPIYVRLDAPEKGTGKNWDDAVSTIEDALTLSSTGSEIWVAEGTYKEPITMDTGVSLYGGFSGIESSLAERVRSSHPTIIDATGLGHAALRIPQAIHCSVDGITITGGSGLAGGGIVCQANSTSTFKNLVVRRNTGNIGGAIYMESTSVADFENCLVASNTANQGGVLYSRGGTAQFVYCTLAGNSGSGGTGFVVVGSDAEPLVTLRSCISWNDTPTEFLVYPETTVLKIESSQIRQPWSGIGNFVADPLFLDYNGGDFRLAEMSPCIDSAIPDLSFESLNGVVRPVDIPGVGTDLPGKGFDRGAYERPIDGFPTFTPTFTPRPTLTPTPTATLPFNLVPDNIVNANDLLEILRSGKDGESSNLILFEFSAYWMFSGNN